jgi:hypothetical protein
LTSLIIQLPDRLVELEQGQEVTFGRGGRGGSAHLSFDDPAVSRLAGRIRAVADYWTVSNLSSRATYVVENPEGGGEFVKVAPGRLDLPVPFEISRLVVPGRDRKLSMTVFAPEHVYVTRTVHHGTLTQPAFILNEGSKYFLVLVALCEPRLRDGASVVLPSVPQIVERLRDLDSCRDLTRSAVNFHIDYLARSRLRVRTGAAENGEREPKADWQRAAIVSTALRFNLVREEHLTLLPSRTPRLSAAGPRDAAHPQMIETISPRQRQ